MQLETKRLFLRSPVCADTQRYTQIHNSEFVLRYNAMQPTTVERMAQKFEDKEYTENTLFLEEKETKNLIGAIFLEEDDLRYGVCSKSLSYFMDKAYTRKGYMKEAMQAVICHLFETEKCECISARVFAPNIASRALLRSLGFRENGILPYCVKGYTGEIFDDVIHTLFPADFYKE